MDQLEGFLDHLGGIADHVEQADGIGLLQPDRKQPSALAGTAGDLVEHRPIAQWPLVVAALYLAREQAAFQFLAAHRLGAAGGELPLHLGG
ncbi:hypothetical protein D9M68_822960 [compost metagenome]